MGVFLSDRHAIADEFLEEGAVLFFRLVVLVRTAVLSLRAVISQGDIERRIRVDEIDFCVADEPAYDFLVLRIATDETELLFFVPPEFLWYLDLVSLLQKACGQETVRKMKLRVLLQRRCLMRGLLPSKCYYGVKFRRKSLVMTSGEYRGSETHCESSLRTATW